MPAKIAFHASLASLLCVLFVTILVMGEATAAPKSPAQEVEIEKLTWTDVRDRLQNGTTTIIVPTGGTEQNGAHMALGKHNFIVKETARRIALALDNALVAPVLAYVPEGDPSSKTGHMAYPGTISLPQNVFEQVLENTALSFKTHGFRTVVFVGDSGGNQAAQAKIARALTAKWQSDGVKVISASDYYAANNGDAYLAQQGMTSAQIGTHAGIRDTSELLYVAPDAVDLNRAEADTNGATGDARLAKAKWGKALIAQKVAAAVQQIRQAETTKSASKPQTGNAFRWLLSLITG
ncbi:MAG: creatininase family protein [Filomicrobium sp.]